MRLGAFVIHGNNRDTLGRCLDALLAVADECVAVDSGSTDGSAELVRARGVRRIEHTWEGYGAARARGAAALRGCDYAFFLDSDEWLEAPAIEVLRAWKRTSPDAPHYSLVRRDWAELPGHRFLYRTERHVRIVRTDAELWRRDMIVHEALPPAPTVKLPAALEHRLVEDVGVIEEKMEKYALLWAIRFRGARRRVKPPRLELLAHFFRETVVKGAALRGGRDAIRLAMALARNHVRKYELLRDVRAGAHADLVRAFEEDRLGDLYRLLAGEEPSRKPAPAPATAPPAASSR